MINSYCYTFQETFNQLSYFGLLESEDAQCFRVDASIESASYILLGAALLLALLNTFVMNAVKQYFRDRDEVISTSEIKEEALRELEAVRKPEQPALEYEDPTEIDGAKAEGDAASEYWDGRKDAESYIKPVPVLFSDKFRWVLRRATPKEELNQGPPLPSPQEMISTVKSGSTEHASDDESPTNNRARRTSGSGSFIRNVNVNLADEVERMEGSNSASTSVAKGRRHRLPSDGDETEV
ncbi:expressed unknown protein [Seminavis robusta]|uniref:Uncharacterized protein n=1 Tax=Seminavis robusta TaxID=568900 RepID=A0A9N8F4H3_9STRA|nr:expressed unknown protein [Seminavis robusta]|eukprot:Sro3474_g348420.1 n/a (239) ;mRNA; r:5705-6514